MQSKVMIATLHFIANSSFLCREVGLASGWTPISEKESLAASPLRSILNTPLALLAQPLASWDSLVEA